MLAGDDKSLFTITKVKYCLEIQQSLDVLEFWCLANTMKVNISKDQAIKFHPCFSLVTFNNYRVCAYAKLQTECEY